MNIISVLQKRVKIKKIILATKRRWNWKVFLVLAALIIPASFAILPYAIHLQNAFNETGTVTALGWELIVINTLVNSLLIVFLGGIGLTLANRIGLGLPFVEGWTRREPSPYRCRNIIAIAWIAAVAFVLTILFLQKAVFGPPMSAMFEELGISIPEEAYAPPLYGFLTAFSAGITEEVLFRLFGLSLLAWLGGLLFHDAEGRPKPAVLWSANILIALAFGAAHLQTAASLGWSINTLVVTRTIVLNSLGGLVFGWLFWTLGFESAMLAHFLTDVIIYTLIPLAALPDGETERMLAAAGVMAVVLLTLFWAGRALVTGNQESVVMGSETRRLHDQSESGDEAENSND